MAGIDRIPSALQQSLLSTIQSQVQANPQIAAVLNSALSLLRSINTDGFTPAAGNTGIVPPNLATGNGNTGIVPPGVTGTNGNTGIVPPTGNTGIVPPGTVTTGNGNTGIVPPNLARPPLPPPPLGTGSGNVGDILARLGQILQILGQLIQSLGGQNGGGKPAPITTSPPWEKEFLAWASPFTKDAYSQLKQNGIQLSEQEAVKLGEMSPEDQKAYVAQRIGGAGAQPATSTGGTWGGQPLPPVAGGDKVQQAEANYLPKMSPQQQAMYQLSKMLNQLGLGGAQGGPSAPTGDLVQQAEARYLPMMSPEQQAMYRLAQGANNLQTGGAAPMDKVAQTEANYLPKMSDEQRAMFQLQQEMNRQAQAWNTLSHNPLAPDSVVADLLPKLSPEQQAQFKAMRAAAQQNGGVQQQRPADSRLQMLQAVVQALSALVSLVSRMTEMNRSRSIAG